MAEARTHVLLLAVHISNSDVLCKYEARLAVLMIALCTAWLAEVVQSKVGDGYPSTSAAIL